MDEDGLAQFAQQHHGVFDLAALRRAGISGHLARRWVSSGRWRIVHPGVFAAASTPDSFELSAQAALLAVRSSVLSLRAAAVVHRIELDDRTIDLSVDHGRTNRLAGVRVHQAHLPPHHITHRNGWAVTTLERTLVDLGKVISANALQRSIEDAVIERRTTLARVEAMFHEHAARGRAGIARTRSVLARLDPEPPTESELEAAFWRLLDQHRLPHPRRQVSFDWLDGGQGRVDFHFPDHRLIAELDGRRFHLRAAAFEEDRRRDQLALASGIATVRFTHHQLSADRAHVVAVLQRLLAGRTSG